MEEVFIRAPALRSLQGKALAGDPRFAIGVYRAGDCSRLNGTLSERE
jgi:hypothetical protein